MTGIFGMTLQQYVFYLQILASKGQILLMQSKFHVPAKINLLLYKADMPNP